MTSRRLGFTFLGLPAYNTTIAQPLDVPTYGRCESDPIGFIGNRVSPPTMSFQLSSHAERSIWPIYHRGCNGHLDNFVGAYPSGVCQNCGSYFPAGLLVCQNCGGYVLDEVVSIRSTKYQILSFRPSDAIISLEDEPSFMDVEIALTDADFTNILNFEILPTGFSLDEDHIICDSCLCIVDAGSICPNCGSARLPFSEVAKIDRECIFCGRKTYDGIMCKSCGASLSGISYREYRRRYTK